MTIRRHRCRNGFHLLPCLVACLLVDPTFASAQAAAPRQLDSLEILRGVPVEATDSSADGNAAPMIATVRQPRAAWAVGIDDAGWPAVRFAIDHHHLPTAATVRPAELANAFADTLPPPLTTALRLSSAVFPSPARADRHIVALGLRTAPAEPRDLHLVVLWQISRPDVAALARQGLRSLAEHLQPGDRLGLVTQSSLGLVLVAAERTDATAAWIDTLRAHRRSSPLTSSFDAAYRELAQRDPHRQGRLLLFTDGGLSAPSRHLRAAVRRQTARGVAHYTYSFAAANDALARPLASDGGGRHTAIDNSREARRVFGARLRGSLLPVAEDISCDVLFDDEAVSHYRFLGNASSAAGTSAPRGALLTGDDTSLALWEVERTSRRNLPLGRVRVAYRDAKDGTRRHLETLLGDRPSEAESAARLAWIAATFGEKLAGSHWSRDLSWRTLLRAFRTVDPELAFTPPSAELRYLIGRAAALAPSTAPPPSPRPDVFDRLPVVR